MLPKNYFILIVITIIIFIKCENKTKSDKNNYFEGTYDFKDFVKEYLTEEKLINSERIIDRKEMEKIFIDILTEKDASYIPEFLKKILDKLRVYFLDKYQKKKKIIRGKDLYQLINIEEISTKFQQISSNPDFDFSELDDDDEDEYEESDSDL